VKVLLDEMLPIDVREFLPGHDVYTAGYAGLAGIPNGTMIRRAIDAGFAVIVSLDRGIPHQQDLERLDVGFVLIPHNDIDLIRPYGDKLRAAVDDSSAGRVIRVVASPETPGG
jgi:hypothetical protein